MPEKQRDETGSPDRDRMLGDEWMGWNGKGEQEIREGKRTFLLVSLLALVILISIALLLLYFMLPRFRMYGENWALAVTIIITAAAALLTIWYSLLLAMVFSKRNYINVCLNKGNSLFIFLFPLALRIARTFGISRDRLSHSFIKVSNELIPHLSVEGTILALFPRCLNKDLKRRLRSICSNYPGVVFHTAPGGTEARRIIAKTSPKAIVAVACERDLVSGIQDIAPAIPVIGVTNTRPLGPCKDTRIDIDEFRSAIEHFCSGG